MKWFLGALFLLFAGFVFELGPLVYAMYVLLGVLLFTRFLTYTWVECMTVTRECDRHSCQIGETIAVAAVVKNTGLLPVPWLLIEDALPRDALTDSPPRIKAKGPRVSVAQLFPLAEKHLLYQLTFQQRGYYQIGPMLLESGDPFGLHRRFKVSGKPNFILVHPKVVPLDGYDISSRRPIGEIRLSHRLFEDPTRISGVRAYQNGDPLNRVHWRASARTGSLHSKTFDASCIAGATLLLDFHQYSHRGGSHSNLLTELTVTTAASLANTLYQMNQQIGLVSNGRDAADRVREEGWKQEFRTRSLASAKRDSQTSSSVFPSRVIPQAMGNLAAIGSEPALIASTNAATKHPAPNASSLLETDCAIPDLYRFSKNQSVRHWVAKSTRAIARHVFAGLRSSQGRDAREANFGFGCSRSYSNSE